MLRRENELRLSDEAAQAYTSARDDLNEKTAVTEVLQQRVVEEFLERGRSLSLYVGVWDGLQFLRSAVGNFPSHLDELRACAQYVDFTQHCRRGSLRRGDTLSDERLAAVPLVDPRTGERTTLLDECNRNRSVAPLVIVSSSSS